MSGTTNLGTDFNGATYQPIDVNSQNNGSGTGVILVYNITIVYNINISIGGSGATGAIENTGMANNTAAQIDQNTVANNFMMLFLNPRIEQTSKGVTLDMPAELRNAALNGAASSEQSAPQGRATLPDAINHSTVAEILPTQLNDLHAITVLPLN